MTALTLTIITVAALLIITGLFMMVRTNNLIRVIISIEVVMKAITLLLLLAGYVNGNYPLAQTFIVTMIVIEVVVAVVAAGLVISIFRRNDSLEIDKLNRLNG